MRFFIPILLLVLAACERPQPPQATTPAPQSAPMPTEVPRVAAEEPNPVRTLDAAAVAALPPFAFIRFFTAADEPAGVAAGIFVTETDLLTTARMADHAPNATILLPCCDTFPVVGVVGFDEAADLAILRIDIPPGRIKPITVAASSATTGDSLTLHALIPLLEAHASKPTTVLSARTWAGTGPRFVIEDSASYMAYGSPVIDSAGALRGIVCGGSGNERAMVTPVAAESLPVSGAPVPLAEHQARELTPAEKARRLADQAKTLIKEGDRARALPIVEQALAVRPDHWGMLYERGVCLDLLGRSDVALAPLQESARIEPGFCESHYSIGLVLLKSGRQAEAIPHFEAAIRADAGYANAHAMLAVACFRSGRFDEAITHGAAATKADPDNLAHYTNLEMFYKRAKRNEDVISMWKDFTAANPTVADGWENLGQHLFDAGDYNAALGAFEKLVELLPEEPVAHARLGLAAAGLGQKERALAAANRALELDPNCKPAQSLKKFLGGP